MIEDKEEMTSWKKIFEETYNDEIIHKTCTDEEWAGDFEHIGDVTEFYAWSKDYVYVSAYNEYCDFHIKRFPLYHEVSCKTIILT